MKLKQNVKIIIDIIMTVVLFLLMAYSMAGEVIHEWLGIGIFVLFLLHHILNSQWIQNLRKGKYTLFRILQTVLVILVLVSMAGSMLSGIVLSRHVFSFLPVMGGSSWARKLHMLSAYWGFIFLSLHLGLHWSMVTGIVKKMLPKTSAVWLWISRLTGLLIACYGIYAFVKRQIGSYMFLKIHFVFFDFGEPLFFFFLDYFLDIILLEFLEKLNGLVYKKVIHKFIILK